jgi:hypothetical protein
MAGSAQDFQNYERLEYIKNGMNYKFGNKSCIPRKMYQNYIYITKSFFI